MTHHQTGFIALLALLILASATELEAQFRNPNTVDTTPAGTAMFGDETQYDSAYRTDLIRKIMPHLNHPDFENAWWGVHVRDLNTGATIFSRNAQRGFMPASNTKLYTTAAALELLGEDFTYKTHLWMQGEQDGSVFRGTLIAEGSGDPTISGRFNEDDRTEVFRYWADSLKALGINRIEGNFIGDDGLFDAVPLGRAWSWDYTSYWYAAEMGALSFNDNTIDVTMVGKVVGEPAELTWEPFGTSYVEIINETVTVPRNAPRRSGYDRPWTTNTIHITNDVPLRDTVRYAPSITRPALYFVHVMLEEFERQGITVSGPMYDRTSLLQLAAQQPEALPVQHYENYRRRATRIATHTSPTLAEIVYIINQRSQNFYAENVLKTIGAWYRMALQENPEIGPLMGHASRILRETAAGPAWFIEDAVEASANDGFTAAWNVFGAAGVDTTRLRLADGSGLSRVNVVSPSMTTAVLEYMWHHPDEAIREAFDRSLPRPGEEIGTLTNMFRNGAARNTVRAKTGTIGMARALSGYVIAADGTPLAFSIMVNHHTESNVAANRIIENIVNTLAAPW
jgi:serine-type D-Ala-D-Ala carboxypeptidase/endopeptidase (penicillin-binding protein 4)